MPLACPVASFCPPEQHGRAGAEPVGSVGYARAYPMGLVHWDPAQRPEELQGGGWEHNTLQRGVGCKYFTSPVQNHEASVIRAWHVCPEQGLGSKPGRSLARASPGQLT